MGVFLYNYEMNQNEELKKKLNIQVIYAAIIFVLITINFTIYFATREYKPLHVTTREGWHFSGIGFSTSYDSPEWASTSRIILWVPTIVLWILGIINAVKINKITHSATTLIVFSVLTLWIAQLIVAFTYKSSEFKKIELQEKFDEEIRKNNENQPKDNDF